MSFKKNLRDYLGIGSANLVVSISYGLFWLFLASILEKTEYGELGYLMAIANIGSAIAFLGVRQTIVVFEPKNENILPAAFIVVAISSTIAAVIAYLISQNFFVSVLIIGMTIFGTVISGIVSKKQYNEYSKHLIIRVIITVSLSLLLFQFFGINGILFGYLIGTFFVLKNLKSLLRKRKIEFSTLRKRITFMVDGLVTRTSDVLFWWSDKIIIGALFGFEILASFHFAVQYMLLLNTVPKSIRVYLLPQEAEGLKNPKMKIFLIILASLVAIISIIVVPFGIETLIPQYIESIFLIQIMSISVIPLAISIIQESQFLGKERSKMALIGNVLQSSIYLTLIIFLGLEFGLTGIAFAFLIAVILRTIFNTVGRVYIKN